MSVDLTNKRFKTYSDFSGGVNQRSSSYQLADNELVAASNMVLHEQGAIRVRKGWTGYAAASTGIVLPARTSHRYLTSDGDKSHIMYGGERSGTVDRDGVLYEDDDAGTYTEIGQIISTRGHLAMVQYRDTMIFTSKQVEGIYHYHADDTSITKLAGMYAEPELGDMISGAAQSVTGGFDGLVEGGYSWYATSTVYSGANSDKDFLGETLPALRFEGSIVSPLPITGGTFVATSGQQLVITKTKHLAAEELGPYRHVNIYRASRPYTAATRRGFGLKPHPRVIGGGQEPAYFVGSIAVADIVAAAVGDELFIDNGSTQLGQNMRTDIMFAAPRGDHAVMFQGRLWLGNLKYQLLVSYLLGDGEDHRPSSVIHSNLDVVGDSPFQFSVSNIQDIDEYDGYEITGMRVINSNTLAIFKENSLHVIIAGSGLYDIDTPITSKRKISGNIGCIAPNSLVEIEGMYVFLSNWGVYAFDGNRLFDLKKRYIEDDVQNIPPSARYNATADYDPLHKEYHLSYATPTSSGYNKRTAVFNFENKSWTFHDHQSWGIVSYFKKQDSGTHPKRFACLDGYPTSMGTEGNVVELDATSDDIVTVSAGTSLDHIVWSFQTKFYDLDSPFADKSFTHVLLQLKSKKDFTMDVLIDDRLDTRNDAGGSFTVPIPSASTTLVWDSGNWDEKNWGGSGSATQLVALDDRCWGKRISLAFSGSGTTEATDIQAITFFYDLKEGVRF